MKKKRNTLLNILIFLIILTIGFTIYILYSDSVENRTLYNSPLINFVKREEIINGKNIGEGYSKAAILACDWTKDPMIGKIEVMNIVDLKKRKYRSVIRYVFQYERHLNNDINDPCSNEYFLKEIILTPDGQKVLKNRSWNTNGCYPSGTSPEICNGIISLNDINESYRLATFTALDYVRPILENDSTLIIKTATYEISEKGKGLPENWTIRITNNCCKHSETCPKVDIQVNISDDGKYIWAVFINGTPEYISKWKKFEYLNPGRPKAWEN